MGLALLFSLKSMEINYYFYCKFEKWGSNLRDFYNKRVTNLFFRPWFLQQLINFQTACSKMESVSYFYYQKLLEGCSTCNADKLFERARWHKKNSANFRVEKACFFRPNFLKICMQVPMVSNITSLSHRRCHTPSKSKMLWAIMQPYLVQILLANHSLLTKFQLHCLYQIYMRCIFTISVRYTWRSKLHMYPGSVSRDRVRNIYVLSTKWSIRRMSYCQKKTCPNMKDSFEDVLWSP